MPNMKEESLFGYYLARYFISKVSIFIFGLMPYMNGLYFDIIRPGTLCEGSLY